MKRARIAWAGAVHDAIEREGRLELLTPAFKNRLLDFGDVVWLPPLGDMPPHRPRTVLALATFAFSFLVRPLGGIIFGRVADRVGRNVFWPAPNVDSGLVAMARREPPPTSAATPSTTATRPSTPRTPRPRVTAGGCGRRSGWRARASAACPSTSN